jgi:hypothetical protein
MVFMRKVLPLTGIVFSLAFVPTAHAKSRFNFSLNIGPQPYPVYAPYPVYQPYYPAPMYAVPAPVPVPYPIYNRGYSRMVCSYDYWGNPYNCFYEYY